MSNKGLTKVKEPFITQAIRWYNQGWTTTEISKILCVSKQTVVNLLKTKGVQLRSRGNLCGERHPNWKGGIKYHAEGYRLILCHNHPRSDRWGYVPEQILVAESQIGRRLLAEEIVHHRNGVRDDNRIHNLQVMTDFDHRAYHASISKRLFIIKFDREKGQLITTA